MHQNYFELSVYFLRILEIFLRGRQKIQIIEVFELSRFELAVFHCSCRPMSTTSSLQSTERSRQLQSFSYLLGRKIKTKQLHTPY
jgi:hypothetical protein